MCRLSWNLGSSTSWNPQGLSRPVMGLLYLYLILSVSVALDIQGANRKRRVILSSVACLAVKCFFHIISYTARFSRKLFFFNGMCVLNFCTNLSEIFLIVRRTDQGIITSVHWYSCQVFVIIVRLYLNLSMYFRKLLRYQIPWKSIQWESSRSMRTDGQTYRHNEARKKIVAFCNFANAPKKLVVIILLIQIFRWTYTNRLYIFSTGTTAQKFLYFS